MSIIASVSKDGKAAKYEEGESESGNESEEGGCFTRLFGCCFGSQGRNSHNNASKRSGGQPAYGGQEALLRAQIESERGRHCLVLDLDETLVHSSFKPICNADFIIPVEIEDQVHQVYGKFF